MKTLFSTTVAVLLTAGLAAQDIDPKMTEVWEPVPPVVSPGSSVAAPPADAIILFDGKSLDEWQSPQFKGEPSDIASLEKMLKELDANFSNENANWTLQDGEMEVKKGAGAIETKQKFGDMQLHIEWMAPKAEGKEGQGYSNSGVFLMGLYEIQVLNSYENKTYPNGQAGSIYKQHIPLANPCRPPGEWQTYDIIFKAPKFDNKGALVSPGYVTLLFNGVLVLNNVELKGPTVYRGHPRHIAHPDKMPLRLQDHGDPVRFRNIWVREL